MTSESANVSWTDANQRVLAAELAIIREALRQHSQAHEASVENSAAARESSRILQQTLQDARTSLPAPSALDCLCSLFGLSPFERATLLLCAGVELDSAFALRCAAAQDDRQRPYPTFSLALAALPDPHWSALTPSAPLRFWRLIEVGSGPAVTTSPLRIDERMLHFLAGVPAMDERLAGYLDAAGDAEILPPTHEAQADQIACYWEQTDGAFPPIVQLCGRDAASKRSVAARACASLGLKLYSLSAERLPQAVTELETLERFWQREAALAGAALLLDCTTENVNDPARQQAVRHWIARNRGFLLISTAEPVPGIGRPRLNLEVRKPTAGEQRRLWELELGPAGVAGNGELDRLVSQFDLSAPAIHAAVRQGIALDPRDDARGPRSSGSQAALDAAPLAAELWNACRAQSRVKLDDLAQRIDSDMTWDDLVVPPRTMAVLQEIALHVRQRARVYETWGFSAKSSRGLGISAMFCGPSGTGKTLAAEILASELELDLYRIDLSQVVSKYIGETEKNLRSLFDAAEEGGAVLLFDEADALFGKRSEVKDSHDRYANIEVSYLLQRMEAYRGLAILTTNMKDALDAAFLRRIRFVVQFPFPDAALRAEIWQRVFPRATPTAGLDVRRLSRLNVAGGNIRNMALSAAFLAAESGGPIGMQHLLCAARSEFAKLERPLAEVELEGWR